MSDSQAYEELTVSSDGVTVVKRFEEDEFPVPAIAFEFTSERDETVTVTLSDTVPEGIEVEDLGFHPEYGSEYWAIDEDTITFERDLDANEEYTTVYGIRATGSDDVEQFLTEPTLEEVDPPLPDEDVIPESGDDVVKDAIAGDGEIPGLEDEDEESTEEDEDVATLDLKDPNEPGGQTEAAAEGEATSEDIEVEGDSLINAMANEIRQKNVSADDVRLLRRALDAVGDSGVTDSGSDAARLDQIQSDVSDLRAYIGALEEFLDENGTGEELIEGFEQRLSEFEETLDSIESDVQSNNQTVQSVDDRMDSVNEEVSSVSSALDSVRGDVESLEGELADVGGSVEEFEAALDDVEASIEELEAQVSDDDLAERLDDIEAEIQDLQEWQEQIKQTFGGG